MRRAEISILKAVGVILMVVGHSGCPEQLRAAIYQFHMPLFFIASGMCLKEKHLGDINGFIEKKLKGVWWPYVKYGTIFLLLHNLFYRFQIYNSYYGYLENVSYLYTTKDFLWNFTKVIRMTGSEQLIGGFWFLHALFWGSIIAVLSLRILKDRRFSLLLLIVISLLMCFFNIDIPIIYISSVTFLAASFFVIGYILQDIKIKKYILLLLFPAIAIGTKYGADGMYISNVVYIIPYIIVATLCTLVVYKVSKSLSYNETLSKYLAYIGDNSLQVLIWHFLSFKLISLVIIKFYDLPIAYLAKFPVIQEYSVQGWWVAYSLVGLAIPLVIHRALMCCRILIFNLFVYSKTHLSNRWI